MDWREQQEISNLAAQEKAAKEKESRDVKRKHFVNGKLRTELTKNISEFSNAIIADFWFLYENGNLNKHEQMSLLELCLKYGFPQQKTNTGDASGMLKRLMEKKQVPSTQSDENLI